MAVSKNDRISSAGLLDVLKGLQNDGHLGKEPEVTEETITYERVVVPAPGTYASQSEFVAAWSTAPNDAQLPFKVYTTPLVDEGGVTYPLTVGEPAGDYVELTKKVVVEGQPLYVEDTFEDISTYTGYLVGAYGGWSTMYYENGTQKDAFLWAYEMPEKTETKTTVEKRTIDPKYLPNANWNENDPEAPGYIEGRTHWVETGTADFEAKKTDDGGAYLLPSFGKPEGFAWNGGEWYPDFEAVKFDNYEGTGMPFYLLAEDENGNQITEYTEEAVTGAKYALLVLDSEAFFGGIAAVGTVDGTFLEIQTVRMVSEIVHKLPKKYIDNSDVQKELDYLDATTPFDYNGKGSGLVLATSESLPEGLRVSLVDINAGSYLEPYQYEDNLSLLNASAKQIALKRLFETHDVHAYASIVELLTTKLTGLVVTPKTGSNTYRQVKTVEVERTSNANVKATIKLSDGKTIELRVVKADGTIRCEVSCSDPTFIDPVTVDHLTFNVIRTTSGGMSHDPALNLLNVKNETVCTGDGSVLINPYFAWAFVNVQLNGGETSKTIKDNDLWAYVSSNNLTPKGFAYFPTLKKHLLCDVTHDTDKESVTLTFTNEDGTAATVPTGRHPGLCFITPFGN